MKPKQTLSAEDVRRILHYDPVTGVFRWLVSPSNFVSAGDVAGKICEQGYRRIRIKNSLYLAHRLAWLCMTGEWPAGDIDHADGDRSNNRWENLRRCGFDQNAFNRTLQKNNRTGFKGVYLCSAIGKYKASIRGGKGKKYDLGTFDLAEEAAHAYNRAAIQLHGEFARLNPVGVPHDR